MTKAHLLPIVFTILILFFLQACDEIDRTINRDKVFTYNIGDTLIYSSAISKDTFLVSTKYYRIESIDKKDIELLEVKIPAVNFDCNPYCFGMEMQYSYNRAYLKFRNYQYSLDLRYRWDSMVNYSIGERLVKDVYKLTSYDVVENQKDLNTIYYTLRNGVIAYELFTGEVFELDESHLK